MDSLPPTSELGELFVNLHLFVRNLAINLKTKIWKIIFSRFWRILAVLHHSRSLGIESQLPEPLIKSLKSMLDVSHLALELKLAQKYIRPKLCGKILLNTLLG